MVIVALAERPVAKAIHICVKGNYPKSLTKASEGLASRLGRSDEVAHKGARTVRWNGRPTV
jgi:hypothetical protein